MYRPNILFLVAIVAITFVYAEHHETERSINEGTNNINIYMSASDNLNFHKKGCSGQRETAAFSVGRATDLSGFPGTSRRVFMDYELANDAGHYNLTTGAFCAPVTGTYVFHYQTASVKGYVTSVELRAGPPDDQKVVAVAFNNYVNDAAFISGSTMVKLHEHDEASLWIPARSKLYGRTPPRTQMYGYLLEAEADEEGESSESHESSESEGDMREKK